MIWRVILFCLLGVVSAWPNLPRHFTFYDPDGRLLTATDAALDQSTQTYNARGNPDGNQ
jgi:YD repeat-containing protein